MCSATHPDSWGSDHLPIVITPAGGKIPRTRQCSTLDWRAFRRTRTSCIWYQQHRKQPQSSFRCPKTMLCQTFATRTYGLPDAELREDGRVGRASGTLSEARGDAKVWRLLRSLVTGPMAPQAVLAVAIRLGKYWHNGRPIASWHCHQLDLGPSTPGLTPSRREATTLPGLTAKTTLCSLYADDVALWVKGPRRKLTAIRRSPQRSLDVVTSSFRAIGLIVSPTKTEALLVHPRVAAWRAVRRLVLGDRLIPWSKAVTYLGLRIDHRLTWIPAVKLATFKATRVQTAVGKLLSRGQGCTPRLALQLYEGAATALAPHPKEQLERQHHVAIRRFMGLPRLSPVAASLAESQTWPLSLLMRPQALHYVDHLHRAPGGGALLRRLRSRPA
ncbi:hypothetical protein HPB52_002836 [Rhipicephalus sanguineus]|uniref:Tick transposon n=1 Tax=Rhipicephalus sanguineus TaxID=34632 RepID=A0A9D4PKF8_RHISA|nr:hypothetical protein HPB52_002836 [Rhipicephalus sanguineus]